MTTKVSGSEFASGLLKLSNLLQSSSYEGDWLSPLEFAESIEVELYPEWKVITNSLYDPNQHYRELDAACGMKGGKTYMAGFYSTYELYLLSVLDEPAKELGLDRDSWIYGICAARNLSQARDGVFREFISKANRCPAFKHFDVDHLSTSYTIHDKNLQFLAGPSNSDALVSKTLAFATLDEMSRFKTTSGERGARSVYEAVKHQLALLDGRLIVISSPLYVDDWIMQLITMAQNNPRMLPIQKATWILNPNFPRDHPAIVDAYERNPEAANRDFGAIPSLALQPFFSMPQLVDNCVKAGRLHPLDATNNFHPWFTPLPNVPYVIAGDPAFRNNAFGIAMGHREGDFYIVDLMHRFFNPYGEIDASAPENMIRHTKVNGFRITKFLFDTWQFPQTIQNIRKLGIDTIRHTVDYETYSFLKELIYGGLLVLYDHPYALEEIKSLELVRSQRVDHRSGFSKDIADAVANVCWGLREPAKERYDTKFLVA